MQLSHNYSFMNKLEQITTLEELHKSFYQCMKSSGFKKSSQKYESQLILNNLQLSKDVRNGTYEQMPTFHFILNQRGKIRDINAPHIRDRVIQKTLVNNVLLPDLRKYLIYDNAASLKERGITFARKRHLIHLQQYIQQNGTDGYILQIDIKKYFDSIDHKILYQLVAQKIEDKSTLPLIKYIIDNCTQAQKGLNLGSEAPQIFAVFFLYKLDNFCKIVKQCKYYGRYMDDIYIFHKDKIFLQNLLIQIQDILTGLKLEINQKKTHITKIKHGYTYLQIKYNIGTNGVIRRPSHNKIVRQRRRIKAQNRIVEAKIASSKDAKDWYEGWKGSLRKDCKQCNKSIYYLDKLIQELYPITQEVIVNVKRTREYIQLEADGNRQFIVSDSMSPGRFICQYFINWRLENYKNILGTYARAA